MDDDVDVDFGGLDLSEVFGIPPVLTDDSEVLLPGRANDLAKHKGQLILRNIEELGPEIARILVKHRGGTLSLPAIRLLSPEVAEILAGYKGTLNLDGLWMLASVPLAKKLAGQWKAQGADAVYPNLSVDVAKALDLWPPANTPWPSVLTRGVADIATTPQEHKAMEQWGEYQRHRSRLFRTAVAEISNQCGVECAVVESLGQPSLLARLAALEKRLCTTLFIEETKESPLASGWFYINEQDECVGPLTWQELETAKDRPYTYCFWQVRDSPGPRMSDLRIGPPNCSDSDSKHERAGLACLLAGERYRAVIQELLSALSVGTLRIYEIDSLCDHYQKLDAVVECGLGLWPALKSIPHVDRLRGRSACIRMLENLLEENGNDLDTELRGHIRKRIRRLRKA